MKRTIITSTLALSLLAACGGDAGSPGGTAGGPTAGSGGSMPDPSGTGAGSDGGQSSTSTGPGGGNPVVYEDAVGAAYPKSGDGRIVLIDPSGTRTLLYNPATGVFESPDDIDELEGGPPIATVVAAGRVGDETYLFDAMGQVTIFDHALATFGPAAPLAEALEDVPFNAVGAAFGIGTQLFVFNAGGTSYAAYNTANETWSPIYSFLSDFGGGGAPIASVGAAYQQDDSVVLFDVSGTSYTVYAYGGAFSDDFDIEDLGDGTLTFNDTSGD